jgi:hypothetical protein
MKGRDNDQNLPALTRGQVGCSGEAFAWRAQSPCDIALGPTWGKRGCVIRGELFSADVRRRKIYPCLSVLIRGWFEDWFSSAFMLQVSGVAVVVSSQ